MKRLINGRMLANKGMRRMWELKPVEVGSTLKKIYWDGTTVTGGQNIVGKYNDTLSYLDAWGTSLRIVDSGGTELKNFGSEKGIYDVSTFIIESFESEQGLNKHIWGAH